MDVDDEQAWLSYRYDRVLIESSRIITPTLPGCTLVLNGAQVEMLRNCVHYLDKRSSFVSEYGDLQYETPDDDNWDEIRAQVADLEEKLMGDLNVPWGYHEQLWQNLGGTQSVDGTYVASSASVPAGHVYKVEQISLANVTGARGAAMFRATISGNSVYLAHSIGLGAWVPLLFNGSLTLKTGDYITVSMNQCLANDILYGGWIGYKMLV